MSAEQEKLPEVLVADRRAVIVDNRMIAKTFRCQSIVDGDRTPQSEPSPG